jgi:hypothetical protein
VALKRPEEEFWNSTLAKIFAVIDVYNKIHSGQQAENTTDVRLSSVL